MADSWLTDGDCNVCRRKKYCSTECKRHRIKRQKAMTSIVMNHMSNFMCKMIDDEKNKNN